MRVSNFFEDGDFAVDALDVGLVLDLVLFQNLDGYLVSGDDVRSLLYLSKGTLALGFADDEASDLLSLLVLLFLWVLFVFAVLSLVGCRWLLLGRWSLLLFGLGRLLSVGFVCGGFGISHFGPTFQKSFNLL